MNSVRWLVLFLIYAISARNYGIAESDQDNSAQTKSFTVVKGGLLDLSVNGGDITIVPWEKNEVFFRVRGVEEEQFKQLEMTSDGRTVEINGYGGGWSGDSRIEVNVPASFRINVKTNFGAIDIRGPLSGTVKATTSAGDVHVGEIHGSVKVRTSGGNIQVGDVEGDTDLKTSGGDVSVGNVSATAEIRTAGGNVVLSNVRGSLSVKSSGGDVRVRDVGVRAEIVTLGGNISLGRVGGGTSLSTAGGDIDLQQARGVVTASTGGGNIRLLDVAGSIMATTGGGDILAELTPAGTGSTMVVAGSGKIRLLVPEDAKATIEARIYMSDDWDYDRETYGIRSDFPYKDYLKYSEKKERRMALLLNGGGQKVTLQTVDADIEIRKMGERRRHADEE